MILHYNYTGDASTITKQLTSITAKLPGEITEKTVREYTYENGRVVSITDYSGFDTAESKPVTKYITYNSLGQVNQLEYKQEEETEGGTDIVTKELYSYLYNKNGYITQENIQNNYLIPDVKTTPKVGTFAYGYDYIGRLTNSSYTDNATSTTTNTSYTYENAGNRLTKTKADVTTSFNTIGTYNQVASSSTTGETSSFTYDAYGNTTNETTVKNWTEVQEGVTHTIETTTTKAYNYK